MLKKGDKKVIKGWVFYDWANSVYNLVISSAIFPIFYDTVTTKAYLKRENLEVVADSSDVTVEFFGTLISPSVLMSFVLSASFLVVSVLSPMLSGIADFSGNKKKFMQFFCYLGAISCITLFWFDAERIELGMLSLFFASIGFWNSLVFYNAYLPEIAEPKDHDKISSKGFIMGYFGSMVLLVICLAMIMFIDDKLTKYSFILVGLWWIIFSQYTFKRLPNNVYNKKKEKGILWKGFKELRKVFVEFKQIKVLKRFLASFFFFNTGVQTVMLMAVLYAKREIFVGEYEAEGQTGLIVAILLIQLLGAAGAFVISKLSSRIGNINSLIVVVAFWIPLCGFAYFLTTPVEFYLLAAGVGVVMGGVQALSRSTYSKFLPETEDHASYFSFYDVTEKIGIVFGTFFFGFMEFITGNIRFSIMSVMFFFVVGLILLFFVPKKDTLNTKSIN
ncbi:MAG: MFS transporter [Fluviicola sp.]|nr:MFS transporter [Fluviicola sp.]